jgi:hypothetical protein
MDDSMTAGTPKKTTRRLRPDVAAAMVAREREARIANLYSRPVEELEPEELARMRAAFFRD